MRIETYATNNISPLLPLGRTNRTTALSAGRDAVELSATARAFLSARQTYATLPAVRQGLVNRFQGQVATGAYPVNAAQCAAAMIPAEGVPTHE